MIEMVSDKTDMNLRIADDYNKLKAEQKEEESFIYKFLQKDREHAINKVAADKKILMEYTGGKSKQFILIRAANVAYNNNLISKEDYVRILSGLVTDKADKTAVKEKLSTEKINELQKKYEKKFMNFIINDYFNRHGMSITGKITNPEKAGLTNDEGYIDDLKLWNALYRYELEKGHDSTASPYVNWISDEYKAECAATYKMLREKGDDSFIIPLHFDKRTGAGVYIIGADRLESDSNNYYDNCYVCVMAFKYSEDGYYTDVYYDTEEPYEELDVSMALKVFDNTDDAFRFFEESNNIFLEYYRELNGEISYNIDDNFKPFFSPRAEKRISLKERILEKQRAEYIAQEKEGIAAMKIISGQKNKK